MPTGEYALAAARSASRPPIGCALLLSLSLLLGACTPARELPNIVVLSLDTVRADAFGPDTEAPAGSLLARLQREAMFFSQARAPMAFTLPSHMTMWTGAPPKVHRVLGARDRLSGAMETLPEKLSAAGYRTIGVFGNVWLSGEFGFARGFEHWEGLEDDLLYADRVADRVLELLAQGDGRPTFLFAHFMDAHSDTALRGNRLPYYSPPGLRSDLDPAAQERASCDEAQRCATEFLLAADREGRAVEAETIETVRSLYARGIRGLDADLGRFVAALDRQGLWQEAIVVVLSDHGEEFREHGRFVHSQTYDEAIRVPLWLKLPDGHRPRQRIDAAASVADLLPTVLDAAGLRERLPGSCTEGKSLLRVLEADGPFARRATLAQDKLFRATWAITEGNLKLIFHRRTSSASLFDLAEDPGELRDIAARRPDDVRRLRALAEDSIGDAEIAARAFPIAPGVDPVLDARAMQNLRALGYLQ